MQISVKSSNGITLVPLETRLLEERKIFIEGEIDEGMAAVFLKQLMLLVMEDAKATISVMINSSGGSVSDGLMMYDLLQSIQTPVNLFCVGKAYSMAAVLFASGSRGRRFILENSQVMLHEPLLGNRVGGNSSSIKSISESLLETKSKLNSILSRHTGKTVQQIDEATSFDHYFTAEEAVEFGLCDEVVGFSEIMGEAVTWR